MASNFAKAAYREVIDLNTESNKVSAIGIHTPTGDTPRKMFPGFFQQYKKYKYKGCSIAFYPIAKLPADPLQVSYDAGEPGIDPRDLANPILVHGCHGDDMGTILNKLYGDNNDIADSVNRLDMEAIDWPIADRGPWYETMERLYYKALTDMTWKKASVQRGFRKGGLRPLVYSLATNHQIMPSSIYPNGMELAVTGSPAMDGVLPTSEYLNEDDVYMENGVNRSNVQFFTPRLTRLGWMDTRQVLTDSGQVDFPTVEGDDLTPVDVALNTSLVRQINWAQLPKLYMLMVLLPPAYKTEMYFRAIVTHYFAFKGFRGISFMPEQTGVPSMFTQEWSEIVEGVVPKDFPDVPIDPPDEGGDEPGNVNLQEVWVTVTNQRSSSYAAVVTLHIGATSLTKGGTKTIAAGASDVVQFTSDNLPSNGIPAGTEMWASFDTWSSAHKLVQVGDVSKSFNVVLTSSKSGDDEKGEDSVDSEDELN